MMCLTIEVRLWGLAIKKSLGDVWHIERDGRAWCDKRIKLAPGNRVTDLPKDAYRCKRCLAP